MPTGFGNAAKMEITFNMGSIEREMRIAGERQAERILRRATNLAVQETEAIIRKEFVNDRSGRRRHGRTQHLAGSIRAVVEGEGRRARLIVYSTADPRKVGALEHGVKNDYVILPDEARFLFFPSNLAERPLGKKQGPARLRDTSRRKVAYAAYNRPKGRGKEGELFTKTDSAIHKAFAGKHFMERGGRRAIRKIIGGG